MTEQELKATVEQIVSLESMADALIDGDDYLKATEMIADAQKLEEDLQRQGFVLGDQHTEVLVYRCDVLGVARSLWLAYDTATNKWRQVEQALCCVCGTALAPMQCPGCKAFFCASCFESHMKDNAKYLA